MAVFATAASEARENSAEMSMTASRDAGLDISAHNAVLEAEATKEDDTLVQFVIVRRDLMKDLAWPTGSVMAQACHACLAVTWENRDDDDVKAYLANLNSMHKVVKEVKGEPQLHTLVQKLRAANLVFRIWTEQPEDIATAIALKPYPKSKVSIVLKKYNLFK